MKKINTIVTLIVLLISGFIGYNTGPEKANAEPLIVPRFVDVPRANNLSGINFNIDLNTGKVVVHDTSESSIKVDIQKKDSIVYKTRVVYEPKYIRIRELPAVKEKKTFVSPNFEQPTHLCVK